MVFLLTAIITFFMCFILSRFFYEMKLYKKNYNNKYVPYSGGTIIYVSLSLSFIFYYYFKEISYIKMIFFLLIITLIYLIGMLDDLLGINYIKGIRGNIRAIITKKFSTGIIKAIFIVLIACYIYYLFNEEFWMLKGIMTALVTNLFNLLDLRPGRCIKFYYIFFLFFSFSDISWTRELFMAFSIIITIYYLWDAYSFSMLGDSGSNLIGFIAGLIISEIIGTDLIGLLILLSVLIILQLILDRYSLTEIIKINYLLDYIDRFLTERQGRKNVEP